MFLACWMARWHSSRRRVGESAAGVEAMPSSAAAAWGSLCGRALHTLEGERAGRRIPALFIAGARSAGALPPPALWIPASDE